MHQSLLILMGLILLSCNQSGGGKSSPTHVTQEPISIEMNGLYRAKLQAVNPTISPRVNGSLTLLRERGELVAHLRFSGGPASILHVQNVHVGTRCPNIKDDLNKDGYIDAKEGAAIYKDVIIPLDDDLNSQFMGLGTFPVADEYGFYSYSRVANWDKFMQDLHEEDINPDDVYIKQQAKQEFTVQDMVVVVLGVPQETTLPDTVEGMGRLNKYQGIPVACGKISKLTTTPGVIDNDHTGIPLPPDGSMGGSDGGDDGANFSASTTTSTGGNYGDDDEADINSEGLPFP